MVGGAGGIFLLEESCVQINPIMFTSSDDSIPVRYQNHGRRGALTRCVLSGVI